MSVIPRKHLAVDERREMIFRHASQVFAAKGFAGTKIADIAQAAGISQGLLYRHFASKEALFTALIAASFAKLIGAAEAIERSALPPHEKIALALQQIQGGLEADPGLSERVLLVAQAAQSRQIPESAKIVILAERHKPYAVIARIMAAGQALGTILPGSPEALATAFWAMVKGLALHKVSFGAHAAMPEASILCRLFLVSQDPPFPENPQRDQS